MPFIDTCTLDVIERLPGWHGRYFHSPSMTFAHYDFVRGSSIHEHSHPQEEVYEVIEGELEMTIDGVAQVARAGLVAMYQLTSAIRSKPSPMAGPSSSTIRCGAISARRAAAAACRDSWRMCCRSSSKNGVLGNFDSPVAQPRLTG